MLQKWLTVMRNTTERKGTSLGENVVTIPVIDEEVSMTNALRGGTSIMKQEEGVETMIATENGEGICRHHLIETGVHLDQNASGEEDGKTVSLLIIFRSFTIIIGKVFTI